MASNICESSGSGSSSGSEDEVVEGVNVTKFGKPDYTNPTVKEHQRSFEEWLFEKFTKKGTSYVLTKVEIDEIKDVLIGTKVLKGNKKYQFKQKRYSLNDEGLVCKTEQSMDLSKKRTGPDVTLPVVWIEQMFEKIYSVHSVARGHQGIRKTSEAMDAKNYGCTENIVTEFRRRCTICNLNKIQQTQERLKPIISTEIFERAQLDLVDMRNHPWIEELESVDGKKFKVAWNWIGHMIDHSGQFHVLWPQMFKTGNCVCTCFHAMCYKY